MPNNRAYSGKGYIGGVARDGYVPMSLVCEPKDIAAFIWEARLAFLNSGSTKSMSRKLLRRWAYYARNGGLTRQQRREAFENA